MGDHQDGKREESDTEVAVAEGAYESSLETAQAVEQAKQANELVQSGEPALDEALKDASVKADRTVSRVEWILNRLRWRRRRLVGGDLEGQR
jgi:hypothetical protein